MKLEAIKRQGARHDLTCTQVGYKLDGKKSVQIVAEQSGESKSQVQRYIRIMEEKVSAPASLLSVPYDLGDKQYTSFVRKFHKEINWFHMDYYEAIFPALTPVQLDYLRQQMDEIRSAVDKLYDQVKGM